MSDLIKAEIGVPVDEASDDFEGQRREVAAALGLEDSGFADFIVGTEVVGDGE